jgi:hypothetical protein
MTISAPNFTRLQDGIKSVDDLRVRGPLNVALAYLSGSLVTQLNTHFGAVSTSISNHISVYASTRPTFQAHKNAVNQVSVSSATNVAVTFGTEEWDTGGFFSSSAWTPPAGKHRLSLSIEWLTNNAVDNEALTHFITKNGGAYRTFQHVRAGTAQNIGFCDSCLIDANGGDVFSVLVNKGGAGDGAINGAVARTWFSGEATS